MDTQIRPVASSPAVVAPSARPTLSLPVRFVSLDLPQGPAVLLAQIRHAILRCADEAACAEPTDTDARLHSFMAKLSGSMESLGQRDLDTALWDLLSTRSHTGT